ncbi:MAG TPA: hypothetical protein VEX38_08235 [Fimbriimonadaceae bacterium]|nr:hypothetical protein [Fimbriimonadaceae bacterium]
MPHEMPLVPAAATPGGVIYSPFGPNPRRDRGGTDGATALERAEIADEVLQVASVHRVHSRRAQRAGAAGAGLVAFAVRFVEVSTGRQGLVLPLGRLEVLPISLAPLA